MLSYTRKCRRDQVLRGGRQRKTQLSQASFSQASGEDCLNGTGIVITLPAVLIAPLRDRRDGYCLECRSSPISLVFRSLRGSFWANAVVAVTQHDYLDSAKMLASHCKSATFRASRQCQNVTQVTCQCINPRPRLDGPLYQKHAGFKPQNRKRRPRRGRPSLADQAHC